MACGEEKNPSMDEKKTGKRISSGRKESGYTRAAAAGKLNLSVDALKSYEYGNRKPSLDTLKQMCGLFHREHIEELIVWKE